MKIIEKLLQNQLTCSSCNNYAVFHLVEDVECDYGKHTLIQCPNCQELFSTDGPCNAFESLLNLIELNPNILSENDVSSYILSVHPCTLNYD